VFLHEALDDGLPRAGALELVYTVQPQKYAIALADVGRIEPGAVVAHLVRDPAALGGADIDVCRSPSTGALDRIGKPDLPDLADGTPAADDPGKVSAPESDGRAGRMRPRS
jgi:hypothetical protein